MKSRFLFFWLLFIFKMSLTFSQELHEKKRVSDKEYRYEFYVTKKIPGIKKNRTYYWFKGGAIHSSEAANAGELIHNVFEKFYLNNQLAEKGHFRKGLKIGLWKSWYLNGNLKAESYWSNGRRNGKYCLYNEKGDLIEKGIYKSDKKHGTWINYEKKDTVFFKKDEIVIKTISQKDSARIVAKKLKIKQQKERKAIHQKNKQKQKQAKQNSKKLEKEINNKKSKKRQPEEANVKKESFLKRLFSKKDKTDVKSK